MKPIKHFAILRHPAQHIAWLSLGARADMIQLASKRSFAHHREEFLSPIVPKNITRISAAVNALLQEPSAFTKTDQVT